MELDFLPEVVVAGDDRILLCQVLTFLSEWTQQTTKTGAHSNKMAWEQDHNHCGIHHHTMKQSTDQTSLSPFSYFHQLGLLLLCSLETGPQTLLLNVKTLFKGLVPEGVTEESIDADSEDYCLCLCVAEHREEGTHPNANLSSWSLSVSMMLLCLWFLVWRLAFSERASSRE